MRSCCNNFRKFSLWDLALLKQLRQNWLVKTKIEIRKLTTNFTSDRLRWTLDSSMTGAYLIEHLVQHVATRPTRSAALPLLTVPRLTTQFTRRSFSYSAPVIWNSLPADILLCNTLWIYSFKRHLKTFLFNSCFYPAWLIHSPAPL